ncbi:uncharacterized protein I303_101457 [Kwoniella dejecticola CBS 10117]|uniref:Uncharacterized protein n=1 Tax=Kwoniella dejecticola CBS 10117 TaxID=1296121 RepID=A0A1A6AHT3_9TREE|nr:uncharacterized protein I303_01466 [Kwoniella dejecticola CBS 10117]OBR89637.1 hypothetical protein I303_01466 [Kwoniella dejecticola CBS 10117]
MGIVDFVAGCWCGMKYACENTAAIAHWKDTEIEAYGIILSRQRLCGNHLWKKRRDDQAQTPRMDFRCLDRTLSNWYGSRAHLGHSSLLEGIAESIVDPGRDRLISSTTACPS